MLPRATHLLRMQVCPVYLKSDPCSEFPCPSQDLLRPCRGLRTFCDSNSKLNIQLVTVSLALCFFSFSDSLLSYSIPDFFFFFLDRVLLCCLADLELEVLQLPTSPPPPEFWDYSMDYHMHPVSSHHLAIPSPLKHPQGLPAERWQSR